MKKNNFKEYLSEKALAAYISGFIYDDGYAHFKKESIYNFLNIKRSDHSIPLLNKIIDDGYILNDNINGAFSRYKIIDKTLRCPSFILREDLPLYSKGFLYCIMDIDVPYKKKDMIGYYSNFFKLDKKDIENVLYSTTKLVDINDMLSNIEFIKFDLFSLYDNISYINGAFYNKVKTKEYVCRYCGCNIGYSSNKEKRILCCKDCYYLLSQDSEYISDHLYDRSKQNSKHYKFNYNLNKLYIKELIERQDYKCAYTGLCFDFSETASTPSIDRIDSSKGYVIGNVAIVRTDINKMKNNYSMDLFKKLVCAAADNFNRMEGVCL